MGTDYTQSGEGRLGVQPLGVVSHGDQQSDGAVRADAHRYEQLRGVALDEPSQTPVAPPADANSPVRKARAGVTHILTMPR